MLDKIVEMFVGAYLQPLSPEQRAEKDIKRKIVFLHEGLIYCYEAYCNYESDANDANLIAWQHALDYLIRLLEDVRTTLASVAPEAFDNTLDFFAFEEMVLPTDIPQRDVLTLMLVRMQFIRQNIKKQKRRPSRDVLTMHAAANKLREFMREHMTLSEIHKAQKAFKADIAP